MFSEKEFFCLSQMPKDNKKAGSPSPEPSSSSSRRLLLFPPGRRGKLSLPASPVDYPLKGILKNSPHSSSVAANLVCFLQHEKCFLSKITKKN
jgi:hypothetical protein